MRGLLKIVCDRPITPCTVIGFFSFSPVTHKPTQREAIVCVVVVVVVALTVRVYWCETAKLCGRQQGASGGIRVNRSFQSRCFLRPISGIWVRCRGTVFISSAITLRHTLPFSTSPSHTHSSLDHFLYSLEL